MPADDGKRGLALPIAVSVLGLAAIGVLHDLPIRHSIEDNLTDRSTAALRKAGVTDATVSFTGRDGTVRVPSPGDADHALAIVRDVNGVRVAKVIVTLGSGSTSPVVTPSATPSVAVTVTPSSPPSAPASAPASAGPASPSAAPSSPTPSSPASPSPAPSTSASPPPSTATLAQVQAQLTSLRKITFASGSARMTAVDNAIAKQIAAIMRAHPEIRIQIQGDTDSVGPAAFNLTMSRMRARAVYNALIANGIAANRMSVIGYGESRPRVPNNSPANRAINRRVDIVAAD